MYSYGGGLPLFYLPLVQDAEMSFCLGLVSLQIYIGVTNNNEKY